MIDKNKIPIFLFIGTLKHHVDCIAPCIGKLLEKEDLGYEVWYCDQTEIKETYDKYKAIDKDKYQVIAFDVGFIDSKTKYQTNTNGIKPASLLKEQNLCVGDMGIIINIKNIYSGSLKNQKKQFLQNIDNEKIHKRVDRVIVDTYIALKKLIRLYNSMKGEECITEPIKEKASLGSF